MTNEFEDMYNTDDFDNEDNQISEEQEDVQDTEPQQQEDLIAGGSAGQVYDINKAPKTAKGPERVDLDGKTVEISKMEIVLPPPDSPWKLSKNGKVKYKNCIFAVYYDNEGQKEYYSGVKVFDRTKDGKVQYSDPTIQNGASTQASQLKKVYAEYKGKTSEEVSMYEFLSFLSSKPKALIKGKDFEYEGEVTRKNIIEKFL